MVRLAVVVVAAAVPDANLLVVYCGRNQILSTNLSLVVVLAVLAQRSQHHLAAVLTTSQVTTAAAASSRCCIAILCQLFFGACRVFKRGRT